VAPEPEDLPPIRFVALEPRDAPATAALRERAAAPAPASEPIPELAPPPEPVTLPKPRRLFPAEALRPRRPQAAPSGETDILAELAALAGNGRA
jgi:hypothetical protein